MDGYDDPLKRDKNLQFRSLPAHSTCFQSEIKWVWRSAVERRGTGTEKGQFGGFECSLSKWDKTKHPVTYLKKFAETLTIQQIYFIIFKHLKQNLDTTSENPVC